MSKISNYDPDFNITPEDKVIGTDRENSNRTKNFTFAQILAFLEYSGFGAVNGDLSHKEDKSNKVSSLTGLDDDEIKYPNAKAVADRVYSAIAEANDYTDVKVSTKADLVAGKVPQAQSQQSTISYNPVNGTITFTDATGTVQNIDLPIENLFQNASYESSTQTLTLTTNGGGEIDIDLSTLVDLPEIVVATSNPAVIPSTGQKLYLRSDNGALWIANGGAWIGPYLTVTSAEKTYWNAKADDVGLLHTEGPETKNGDLILNDKLYLPDLIAAAGTTNNIGVNDAGFVTNIPTEDLSAGNIKIAVTNKTGVTVVKGSVVYINGAQGSKATIALALADPNVVTSAAIGIVEANIVNNASGYVVALGEIKNLNTASFTNGDKVYLSPTTPGALTNSVPVSPNNVVFIGTITNSHATQGEVLVNIFYTTKLDRLADVAITTPVNNNLLVYETSSDLWKNKTAASIGLVSGSGITDTVPKWVSASQVGISNIKDNNAVITLDIDSKLTTGNLTFNATQLTEDKLKMCLMSRSTGIYAWASGITAILGGTTFNVGSAQGFIVSSSAPTVSPTFVNYIGGTSLTTPHLLTAPATYVLIKPDSTLLLLNIEPTVTQKRDNIYLGVIGHPSGTITGIGNSPDILMNEFSQTRAMFEPTRLINEGVLAYANSTNLSLANTAGKLYGFGIGFIANGNDAPSIFNVAAGAPMTTQYRTQGTVTFPNTTVADPLNYDLAGVQTAIPGSPNQATNQRFYLLQNGMIRIQYGQTIYPTLIDAIAAASNESFVVNVNARKLGILIGILSIQKGCTNLSNTATARFLPVSKFGETVGAAAGISIGTLQTAYDNSLDPEIVTNSTLDGFTVRRGSAADTDNIIVGQNGAGTITASIDGNGKITGTSIVKSGAAATDALLGTGLTTHLESGTYTPTVSNLVSVNTPTSVSGFYTRIGNTVNVMVSFAVADINPPPVGGMVSFDITLPFTAVASSEAVGSGIKGSGGSAANPSIAVIRSGSNVNLLWFSINTTNSKGSVSFTYIAT